MKDLLKDLIDGFAAGLIQPQQQLVATIAFLPGPFGVDFPKSQKKTGRITGFAAGLHCER
jgi:hypothetical protein